MIKTRLGGSKNYLYYGQRVAEVEGPFDDNEALSSIPANSWFEITDKEEVDSVFGDAEMGDILFTIVDIPLSGDDKADILDGYAGVGFWYKVLAIGSSTKLPVGAMVNDVFFVADENEIELAEGDKLVQFLLEKAAFVTDVPNSSSKDKFENTTQVDDVKSYVEGDKAEKTGTINGFFVVPDTLAEEILMRFARVVKYEGASKEDITYNPTKVGVIDFFLGRNEKQGGAETYVMEYLPAIIDTLDMEKPMDGNQTFNFGYTAIGSERPSIHYFEPEE